MVTKLKRKLIFYFFSSASLSSFSDAVSSAWESSFFSFELNSLSVSELCSLFWSDVFTWLVDSDVCSVLFLSTSSESFWSSFSLWSSNKSFFPTWSSFFSPVLFSSFESSFFSVALFSCVTSWSFFFSTVSSVLSSDCCSAFDSGFSSVFDSTCSSVFDSTGSSVFDSTGSSAVSYTHLTLPTTGSV